MNPPIILDAHLDLALNFVTQGRDVRRATWQTHQLENNYPLRPANGRYAASVGLPDMLLGRVGVVFATLWVQPAEVGFVENFYYETPRQAYQQALHQLDYYHRLVDEDERVRIIRTQQDLQAVLASWSPEKTLQDRLWGVVVLMEGADPIIEPRQAEEWYERDVRIIGPAWRATRYAAGTGEPGKLTKLGWELLDVMTSYNMILDLSHLAEYAYKEALENYPGPVLASHSNPRHFVNTDRHLSDDMIRRLAERDGVMGIVPFNEFLVLGWKTGRDRKHAVGVNRVLDMIDHVCQITGSADHVGLGTDWDGGFGWESIPAEFDSHLDLWRMNEWLAQRGFDAVDIDKILSGNFLRVLKKGLPA